MLIIITVRREPAMRILFQCCYHFNQQSDHVIVHALGANAFDKFEVLFIPLETNNIDRLCY